MPSSFLLFNATSPPPIYTLSLHDALPIYLCVALINGLSPKDGRLFLAGIGPLGGGFGAKLTEDGVSGTVCMKDRKSTRLNSSHVSISYAVFCLKKKNKEATLVRL